MGADGRGQQSAALFLDSACFAPSHAGDHGGRCSYGSHRHKRTCLLYSVPQSQPFSMCNVGS